MASSSDSAFLARAIELAARGRLRVEPNPPVGCVLVRKGTIVGEGWHAAWGEPHAEAAALRQAGGRARGSTAFVTLEPCAHHGKTPPCADALLAAGVTQVVYAVADKNPVTAGEGPRRLRAAGCLVRRLPAPAALRRLLAPYFAHLSRGRPWVIAKWAMTLDGHIATRTGDSRWVSAAASLRWAHRTLRAHVDAIVVGARTVRVDDPLLTVRHGARHRPLRVVVGGREAIPSRARVLHGIGPTLVAVPAATRAPRGVESVVCGSGGRVSPARLLRELYRRGIRRILLEGGGSLVGSFLDRRLVDQVAVIVAPKIVGGENAPPAVGGRGGPRMSEAFTLSDISRADLDGDQLLEGLIRR